jgi:hypothetical protein
VRTNVRGVVTHIMGAQWSIVTWISGKRKASNGTLRSARARAQ